MHPLEPLFNPKIIVAVGASSNRYKPGHQLIESLKDFPGLIFPVNPKAKSVLGYTTYPDLFSIPQKVDLAILAIPTATCPAALEDAGKVRFPRP